MKPYYKTIGQVEDEQIIKKSRFKTFLHNIRSEEEAVNIIAELRARFKDATHVCYAYVLSTGGVIERFSDDGEPSGTAGMPMLEVIKHSKLCMVLAVVVRYFGGIKLGAGGLVRAYADCVKSAILKAEQKLFVLCRLYRFSLDYSTSKKIGAILSNLVCKTLEIGYNEEGVSYKVAVNADSQFASRMNDFCLGRVEIAECGMEYIELDSLPESVE